MSGYIDIIFTKGRVCKDRLKTIMTIAENEGFDVSAYASDKNLVLSMRPWSDEEL